MTPVCSALNDLASTSASFLILSAQPPSSAQIPAYKPLTISPFKESRYKDLLNQPPRTQVEHQLMEALRESELWDTQQKYNMVGMQAATLLQGTYVARVRTSLQEKEKKDKEKKNILFGDGMPRVLSDQEFVDIVKQKEAEAEKKACQKAEKSRWKGCYTIVIQQWKKDDEAQRARNKETTDQYHAQLAAWKAESETTRKEKRKPGWTKPKRGNIEKGEPWPKHADFEGEEEVNTMDDDSDVDEVAQDDEAELD
ncbi:hypothetical protein PTI98_012849 [Pleurotus ostreatus]|nr:hypothetical protein PTI98_012849 [Pleurotus ostreatus]